MRVGELVLPLTDGRSHESRPASRLGSTGAWWRVWVSKGEQGRAGSATHLLWDGWDGMGVGGNAPYLTTCSNQVLTWLNSQESWPPKSWDWESYPESHWPGEWALHLTWAKKWNWPWWQRHWWASPKVVRAGELALAGLQHLGEWASHLDWAAQQNWLWRPGCGWASPRAGEQEIWPRLLQGEVLGGLAEQCWRTCTGEGELENDLLRCHAGPDLVLSLSWPTPESVSSVNSCDIWKGQPCWSKAAGSPWHRVFEWSPSEDPVLTV